MDQLAPEDARVPSALPRGAYRAALDGVRTEEVIDDAPCWVVEQHGLGRSQHKGDARTRCRAHVILAAEGVADEKRFVSLGHLKGAGHWWRRDILRVTDLRERDHESCRESADAGDEPEPARDVVSCVANVHAILLIFEYSDSDSVSLNGRSDVAAAATS